MRNSGIKNEGCPVRFLSGSQHHGPDFYSEANRRENFGCIAKMFLHSLLISKKHMTEFLRINFGRFCRSMAFMVNCYVPLSHSTAECRP